MFAFWYLVIGFGVLATFFFCFFAVYTNKRTIEKKYFDGSSYFVFVGDEGLQNSSIILGVISACFFITFLLVSIMTPIGARREVAEWREFSAMVEETIVDTSDYADINLRGKVVEYNKWLSGVKARKQVYGNWSAYCYENVENLEYIKFGEGTNDG